jgi:hypothetical protein
MFIAGGAGLGIAKGLLFPGLLPRKESLAQAGSRSVRLVLGTIPMLLVAGFVEGFVSPTSLAPSVKFLLAGGLGTLLVLYLASGTKVETEIAGTAPPTMMKKPNP